MTREDDDVTELSARAKDAGADDDVTSLSKRAVAAEAPAHPAGAEADEGADLGASDDDTRLSDRGRPASQDLADSTRLSQRTPAPAPRIAPLPRSALPPGAIGGAAAERGVFGQPAEAYTPREAPPAAATPPPTEPATPVPIETGMPDPMQVQRRREAARHRRLITAVIVVAITAAVMTVAAFGIVALLNRTP